MNKKLRISEKSFHKNRKPIHINEVDIKGIALSHKKSYGKDLFKYFIGYRHKGNAFPSSSVKLPKMNAYAKCFYKNSKYINLLINEKEILEKIF